MAFILLQQTSPRDIEALRPPSSNVERVSFRAIRRARRNGQGLPRLPRFKRNWVVLARLVANGFQSRALIPVRVNTGDEHAAAFEEILCG
jgi:hypothetical protein